MKTAYRKDLPDGWSGSMVYDHRGDGRAVFTNGIDRKTVRAGFYLGWDSQNESFMVAATRELRKRLGMEPTP